MVYGLIIAAGNQKRFDIEIPKALVKIKNQTLLDMIQSMMLGTDLPLSVWGLALETLALLLNQVSS